MPAVDATPTKKRGMFLPGRFFGGKDKEPILSEAKSPETSVSATLSAPTLNPLSTMASVKGAGGIVPPPLAIGNPDAPVSETEISPGKQSSALTSKLAVHAAFTEMASGLTSPSVSDLQAARLPGGPVHDESDRAHAQLTFSFEITALQLTPFFRLGSVQLKALSNFVSLQLITPRTATNPLTTGISFQVDQVELEDTSRIRSILLKPLDKRCAMVLPSSRLQVDHVAFAAGDGDAPIYVTTLGHASTAVQVFGTFTVAELNFTPSFRLETLRLEPTTNQVLLRVSPSNQPTALDLPPAFEIVEVREGDGTPIGGLLVVATADRGS